MIGSRDRQSSLNIPQMVDQIIAVGQLSRKEYVQLTTTILSDYSVTEEERRQINRIFDEIHAGKLKIFG